VQIDHDGPRPGGGEADRYFCGWARVEVPEDQCGKGKAKGFLAVPNNLLV